MSSDCSKKKSATCWDLRRGNGGCGGRVKENRRLAPYLLMSCIELSLLFVASG
jgi:hypothetical protein